MRSWRLFAALLMASCALGQEASSGRHGSWAAAAGTNQIFRGTWTGGTLPGKPNIAQGSWTLISDTGETTLEGTWSAAKSSVAWQGTWTARTVQGRTFSGTWRADLADFKGKTFEEMLELTAQKEVAGWWRSGRYQGNWWLKSSPPQGRKL
jgi:hypothetical protein